MANVIRRASKNDIKDILVLLEQVLKIHNKIRPDIFKEDGYKYSREQLEAIIADDSKPVYVYDIDGVVVAHAFCWIRISEETPAKVKRKTMFIDDLVVRDDYRGKGIGTTMLEYVKKEAKGIGCVSVTLDVWDGNDPAIEFYNKNGFKPQQIIMEEVLE